jgi:hypothetical protein
LITATGGQPVADLCIDGHRAHEKEEEKEGKVAQVGVARIR